MSSYVASTSNNKPTQHIITGKVQQMESRKRPHPLEDERLCGASSVTNKSEQRKIYVDIPAKRICRVNVSTKALDKQSLSGQKLATGCGSGASVVLPLISVQVNPSSLVRKERSAFVSADAVPVVFVPLQLMMQQMQPQQQQQMLQQQQQKQQQQQQKQPQQRQQQQQKQHQQQQQKQPQQQQQMLQQQQQKQQQQQQQKQHHQQQQQQQKQHQQQQQQKQQMQLQQQQFQKLQQQQRNKVLPTSLPQQHSKQTVTCPTTASQLQQEIDVLKQKRKDLLQRLSLFHQLFRNKERLASVARRLGIKIE